MLYPNELIPNATESFIIDNAVVEVPKCIVQFDKWDGIPLQNTFGNKPVLKFNNKPMFAELIIMNIFHDADWNSRWVETYGKPKLAPIYLTEWIDDTYKNQNGKPIEDSKIQGLINSIAKENDNTFGGCWDVFAWKEDFIIFAEAKRSKKDALRSTQNKWINSVMRAGLKRENFFVVEWEINVIMKY